MKRVAYVIIIITLYSTNVMSQITIGSSERPLEGILLEIKTESNTQAITATQGVLLPRVALEDKYKLDPLITSSALTASELEIKNKSHTGAIVFNVESSGLLEESLHYWDGMEWINLNKAVVTISTDAESNSFIIPTVVNRIEIPTTQAVKVWNEYVLPSAINSQIFTNQDLNALASTASFSAKLLWADAPYLVTGIDFEKGATNPISDGKLIVRGRGNRTGNAVVALLMNNVVVWSWHIWFTDYNPNGATPTTVQGEAVDNGFVYRTNNSSSQDGYYIWMDRNLGSATNDLSANQYNLYYQWGRKDPFPASQTLGGTNITLYDIDGNATSITTTSTVMANPLLTSINQPTQMFLTASGHPNSDWFYSSSANNVETLSGIMKNNNLYLWDNNGDKSLFDPCPNSWRVPYTTNGQTPWNKPDIESTIPADYTSQAFSQGYNFNMSLYNLGNYPATGYINGTTGVHSDNGTRGIVWGATSSLENQASRGIMFTGSSISIDSSLKRSHGIAVRCVKVLNNK